MCFGAHWTGDREQPATEVSSQGRLYIEQVDLVARDRAEARRVKEQREVATEALNEVHRMVTAALNTTHPSVFRLVLALGDIHSALDSAINRLAS